MARSPKGNLEVALNGYIAASKTEKECNERERRNAYKNVYMTPAGQKMIDEIRGSNLALAEASDSAIIRWCIHSVWNLTVGQSDSPIIKNCT